VLKKCRICHIACAENSVYCEKHQLAYENLEKAYTEWKTALNISWTDYLKKILKIKGTGQWAKEVAENILENS
jgi:DNA topoisomerase-1